MHEVVPLELGSSPVLDPGCAASDTLPVPAAHAAITVRMPGYSIEIADGASEDTIRNTLLALGRLSTHNAALGRKTVDNLPEKRCF